MLALMGVLLFDGGKQRTDGQSIDDCEGLFSLALAWEQCRKVSMEVDAGDGGGY